MKEFVLGRRSYFRANEKFRQLIGQPPLIPGRIRNFLSWAIVQVESFSMEAVRAPFSRTEPQRMHRFPFSMSTISSSRGTPSKDSSSTISFGNAWDSSHSLQIKGLCHLPFYNGTRPSYTPLQEPATVLFVYYLQKRGLIRGINQARQIQATAEDSHRIGNQKTWEGPFRVWHQVKWIWPRMS